MARPQCPFDCGRTMDRPRNEGETDLKWWERDRGREYHPSVCAGHALHRRAWSLQVYGVEDTAAAKLMHGKVVVTVEIEIDVTCYSQVTARQHIIDEWDTDGVEPRGSIAFAVQSGAADWRQLSRKVVNYKPGRFRAVTYAR